MFAGMKKFKTRLLKRIDQENYLAYKKAEFLLIMITIYAFLLLLLPFGFLTVSFERFLKTFVIISPFIVIALISLFLITRGKTSLAATLISVTAILVDTYLYFARDPLLAIASFGYIIIMLIVFAALYTPVIVSALLTASYVISHVIHIYIWSNSELTV